MLHSAALTRCHDTNCPDKNLSGTELTSNLTLVQIFSSSVAGSCETVSSSVPVGAFSSAVSATASSSMYSGVALFEASDTTYICPKAGEGQAVLHHQNPARRTLEEWVNDEPWRAVTTSHSCNHVPQMMPLYRSPTEPLIYLGYPFAARVVSQVFNTCACPLNWSKSL